MTTDKHAKRAARELATRENISYTAARRRLAEPSNVDQEQPPQLIPIAIDICPESCDGSGHPGALCRPWRARDVSGKTARWDVRRAADLPAGRADQVAERAEGSDARSYGRYPILNDAWLLALVYGMLTDQEPELRPDRVRLRAAVEADDLAEVDAVMRPLDRAAARLMTKNPDVWRHEVKPRLDAYADVMESDTRELPTWPTLQELDDRAAMDRLVRKWRTAWTPAQNYNGYWDPPGVMWMAPKRWLDSLLISQHGGHAGRVRLAGGRPALVYAVEWGEEGPPIAYHVREMEPGRHGNVGRLVPSLTSDVLVPAADCRTDKPCQVCGQDAGMTEALCDGCAANRKGSERTP
ncbi:hypothetical protein AB0E67_27270 [Streptomyces sp. NPDC032161]|uniref:hypothetical protein n=1 Tax=unclassified Streptomyces TaxID=2593676 RepID=UPI0033CA815E